MNKNQNPMNTIKKAICCLSIVTILSLIASHKMLFFLSFWALLSLILIILIPKRKEPKEPRETMEDTSSPLFNMYSKKEFLTPYEIKFYYILSELNAEYIVIPQVNLASIIDKNNGKYRNELFRNIDFGIFSKNFELLLLIELNDKSHQTPDRQKRDLKVKKIINDCNIPLLTFYSYYPNEKEYVIRRIKKTLNPTNDDTTLSKTQNDLPVIK